MPTTAALNADEQADLLFKALSSKARRDVLRLLATGGGEGDARCCSPDEVCACVLVEKLGIGAPTVSHHMKALIAAQLVSAEKRGAWVYYRLRDDAVERLTREVTSLLGCAGGACS